MATHGREPHLIYLDLKKKQIAVIIAVLAIIGLLFYFNTASAPKINTEVPQDESPSAQKIDINADI